MASAPIPLRRLENSSVVFDELVKFCRSSRNIYISERVELWESVQPSPSTIMHIKVATVNAYGKMIQAKRPALPMVVCGRCSVDGCRWQRRRMKNRE